ncbi:hypothetical protein EST38_g12944 [Candolleomyces aberdarensis]|uniref:Uncharacterized protein n=1 Tax=Candolleomyces aberdarensis TaxID=2316362 RepID=A0A4Q2D162_9AGAR|nr:hypothetical protein EST38_g12944 [Candolleomyces aberdarensis]
MKLPPNTPPPPHLDRDDDPWYPFDDEGGFQLADFLFCKDEMPAKKIDYLLEIWAFDKMKNNTLAPFSSYTEMYNAIDSIEFGNAPWQSFSMNFADDPDHPADTTWKSAAYEVWYQDPARVISNMLNNPDFDRQFDHSAFVEVFLPAIKGHVPNEMVQAISAFLDFCYLARRADITEETLKSLDNALQHFYLYRKVFKESGVRPTGFSLTCQHALSHYQTLIEDFGAPGGLCSSITKSRHITTLKKPWRHSNWYEALGQMLLTNQWLDKLAGARGEFVRKGLLNPLRMLPLPAAETVRRGQVLHEVDREWEMVEEGRTKFVEGNVTLARQHVRGKQYPKSIRELAQHIHEPDLLELARRFLFDQLHPRPAHSDSGSDVDTEDDQDPGSQLRSAAADVHLDECPSIAGPVRVYHSAIATFYAPSDDSGLRGMRRERIRSVPAWRKQGERRDCALVVVDESEPGFKGVAVIRPGKRPIDLIIDFLTRLWNQITRDNGAVAAAALNTVYVWLTVPAAWFENFTCFNLNDPRDPTVGPINGQLDTGQFTPKRSPLTCHRSVHQLLKDQPARADQPIHALLVVGGFAGSEYMKQHAGERLRKLVTFIARPPAADTATLRSAAQQRLARTFW